MQGPGAQEQGDRPGIAGEGEPEAEFPQTPEPVLRRVGAARQRARMEPKFDHVGPDHQLTQDKIEFFAQVESTTLDRFEAVFRLISAS